MKRLWVVLAFASTALAAQPVEAAGDTVDITLQSSPAVHSLRLRVEGDAAAAYDCAGPCVLHVSPGRYQLDVSDEHGESRAHALDLVRNETITVAPPRHRLVNAGAVLVVSGLAIGGLGAAVFTYGTVKDLRAWGCDTGCETVSQRTIVTSAAVFSAGIAVVVAGAVLALIASRPTIAEHPEP